MLFKLIKIYSNSCIHVSMSTKNMMYIKHEQFEHEARKGAKKEQARFSHSHFIDITVMLHSPFHSQTPRFLKNLKATNLNSKFRNINIIILIIHKYTSKIKDGDMRWDIILNNLFNTLRNRNIHTILTLLWHI